MFAGGENILCTFDPTSIQRHQTRKIRALIMGHTGNGKTSFINKSCNKLHDVGISRGSKTRDIAYEDLAYFPPGVFRIYDTPGTDSRTNAYEHALILKTSLTSLPLNLIIIQAKLDSRFEKTIAQFKEQIKIFKGNEHLVVFMISHLDTYKPEDRAQLIKEFPNVLEQFGMKKCPVIFYSNTNSEFSDLCEILYCIGSRNQEKTIKIEDSVFFKYFNITSPQSSVKSDIIANYIEEIKENAESFVQFFSELPKDLPDIDEVVSDGKQFMKYFLKELQDRQYKQYMENLNDMQSTDVYLTISQIIQSKLEEVDCFTDLKIKKIYYEDQYKKQLSVFDLFKQCPNCKLIWMKVQGCDGDTTCGNKPNFYDYFRNKDMHRYDFQIVNGRVNYVKKNVEKISVKINSSNKKENNFFTYSLGDKKQNIGCGKSLNWGKLPRIPDIEERLKDMYGVSNFSELKLQLEKLTKTKVRFRQQIEQKVKKTVDLIKKETTSQKNLNLMPFRSFMKGADLMSQKFQRSSFQDKVSFYQTNVLKKYMNNPQKNEK